MMAVIKVSLLFLLVINTWCSGEDVTIPGEQERRQTGCRPVTTRDPGISGVPFPRPPPIPVRNECGRNKNGNKGYDRRSLSKRIIGGSTSKEGTWPWMVALFEKNYQICGGSLISDRWVLTAAHCLNERYNNICDMKVQIGENSLTGKKIKIDKIIMHRAYFSSFESKDLPWRFMRRKNDIALLRLADRVDLNDNDVNVICLPSRNEDYNKNKCYVAGWGRTTEDANGGSQNLLHVKLIPMERAECLRKMPKIFSRPAEGTVCTKGSNSVDFCKGDSGGPLICKNNAGKFVQFGIIGWQNGCARSNSPSVYSDVRYYLDWIEDVISRNGGR